MKKIFTLLCAAVVALSVSAAPLQFGKKSLAHAPQVLVERAVAENANAFKAPKAIKEEAEIDSLTVTYFESNYYAQYGFYAYILVAEDGTVFYFCFPSTGADPVVNGQTYTLADLNADYSYYDYLGIGYYTIAYSAVSFTKTVDAAGNVTIIVDTADDYGFAYHLTYDEASLPKAPKGGNFTNLEVEGYVWTDSCQYILSNDSLTFYFAFTVENLVSGQEYTMNNAVPEYSGIIFNQYTVIDYSAISFIKTDGENGSYSISATILDVNGDTWTVSGSFVPEISDMTFAFSFDEAAGITVTPSNNTDAWDWIVVSDAVFGQYGAEYIAETIYGQYGNQYAMPGAATLSWDEDLANYIQTSGNYVLVVWGAGEKNVTTAAASYQFTAVVAEGIENTEAEIKAVKKFENGILVIEKNGVKYNAQGAILK